MQFGQLHQGGDVAGLEVEGALEHGDRLLPVVLGVDALGEQAQKGGIGGGRRPREGLLGGGAVAEAQQGLTEIEHRAVALGPQVNQLGEGSGGPLGIAGLQAPDAQPVEGFTGDGFGGLGLADGGGLIAPAGEQQPAQPVGRRLLQPLLQGSCALAAGLGSSGEQGEGILAALGCRDGQGGIKAAGLLGGIGRRPVQAG